MLGERPPGSFLTAGYSRTRLVPWGIDGGLEGTANYIVVRRKTGQTEGFSMVSNLRVDTDDVIPVVTGNGAGYGDPARRLRASVQADIRQGYVSLESVQAIYGYKVPAE